MIPSLHFLLFHVVYHILNLNFISKMLEKVFASRIRSHLSSNSLSFSHSAHRIFHSTETTIFKIHNDLVLVVDRGEVTCILLDLFTAFDTVDHSPFSLVFTSGLVLMAFHLIGPHLISFSDSLNLWFHLCIFYSFMWCTPKFRSWPTAFYSWYCSSWFDDLKKFLNIILYAGDTQLYISFTSTNSVLSLETLTTTFTVILSWINLNLLLHQKLNSLKTENRKQQRLKCADLKD